MSLAEFDTKINLMNFKACFRDNSFNTPLPPLHKVPTEGFSA